MVCFSSLPYYLFTEANMFAVIAPAYMLSTGFCPDIFQLMNDRESKNITTAITVKMKEIVFVIIVLLLIAVT
jgi:hypothetical protein